MMRVSIICPVFNTRPEELRDAVASALGQTIAGVHEIILVDDGSTSSQTLATLESLKREDPRVIVVRSLKNAGPAMARNLGLSRACGDWIGFLDADDLWPASKLAQASLLLAQRPDCQWIVGDFANLGVAGIDSVKPGASCFSLDGTTGLSQCSPALTRSIILDGLHLGTCLFQRVLIGQCRFDPKVEFGEDLLFLAKMSLLACAHRAPGLSYLCRRQHESMMYSFSRLTVRYASGARAGMRDRALRTFRREYRWALYDIYKDLAVNNLLNHRPLMGLRFAFCALRLDPREVKEMAQFLALLFARDRVDVAMRSRRYSKREQVLFKLDGTLDQFG